MWGHEQLCSPAQARCQEKPLLPSATAITPFVHNSRSGAPPRGELIYHLLPGLALSAAAPRAKAGRPKVAAGKPRQPLSSLPVCHRTWRAGDGKLPPSSAAPTSPALFAAQFLFKSIIYLTQQTKKIMTSTYSLIKC